ncbi:uncharacterized protein A4U43_UnF2200 [Asparagus officinalis]|uniref:RING-type E3 ubiquitin transferase n=1 Tax=Asparagus officinalis TaxID=4686 RepID=A0A1R3L7D9_ASPOF|nr:uncharacterized protein A4U43_UnF2200 [Asparagus officinalis]
MDYVIIFSAVAPMFINAIRVKLKRVGYGDKSVNLFVKQLKVGKRASFKKDRRAIVKEYEQREREKMQKCLDGYMNVCLELKMQAEKLVMEADAAAKGLLELISTHKIDNLVMGSAADKHYPMSGR